VTYVSFFDALRFSNWLNNGQGLGDTETGAYTRLGGTATPSNGTTVTRNGSANTFLTSENEWYKAAYYSPGRRLFRLPDGDEQRDGLRRAGRGHRQLGELLRRGGRAQERRRVRTLG
jgi:hypothetical protein